MLIEQFINQSCTKAVLLKFYRHKKGQAIKMQKLCFSSKMLFIVTQYFGLKITDLLLNLNILRSETI